MNRILMLALTVSAASANVIDINASERGRVCNLPCTGNNNGADPNNNYFSGFTVGSGFQIRNWFEFSIPTLTGGTLVSATLQLDEPPSGHLGGMLTFAVYGLSAQPLIFTDVSTSSPFGSVGTTNASSGTTLAITLNPAAIVAITSHQMNNIFLGGIDTGENSSTGDFAASGFPAFKTVLSLTTAPASVPEPSSLSLLAIAGATMAWRKRRSRQ
ncbi:MAG TPA: PEP-CTERM sorting domain-containing protein [Bryobacteraceae bacterium]|nr:PEP-CTERM sorting domain-containing protein [Bryobacteraceae bacterium]